MTVIPRGNSFEVCVTLPGGRRIRRAARTRAAGELIEIQIRNQVLPPTPVSDIAASITFKTLLDECINDWIYERGVRSFRDYFEPYCKSLFLYFGSTPIRAITKGDVKKFKAWRVRHCAVNKPNPKKLVRLAADGTVGNSLRVLRRVFNYAIEEELLDRNPVKGVRIPKAGSRNSFASVDEQNRLLAEALNPDPSDRAHRSAADFQDLIFCAFRTGIRTGFLKKIRLGDFDPLRSQVTLKRTKKGDPWTVRLLPVVCQLFLRRAAGLKAEDFILSNCGRPWGKFYKRFYSACRRAGLKDFRPHDCRHTFASDMRAAGVPLDRLRDFMDHTNLATTERYAHLGAEFQKLEIDKYENHLRECGAFTPHGGGISDEETSDSD